MPYKATCFAKPQQRKSFVLKHILACNRFLAVGFFIAIDFGPYIVLKSKIFYFQKSYAQ